jgi:hypothetical protein
LKLAEIGIAAAIVAQAFGPDTPERVSSKIAPGDFVEPSNGF